MCMMLVMANKTISYLQKKEIKDYTLSIRLTQDAKQRLDTLCRKLSSDGKSRSKAAIVDAGLKALEDAVSK